MSSGRVFPTTRTGGFKQSEHRGVRPRPPRERVLLSLDNAIDLRLRPVQGTGEIINNGIHECWLTA